jgi:hypothetical protein
MAKVALSVLGWLQLAACNDTSGSTVVQKNTQACSILYSPGMPTHPR